MGVAESPTAWVDLRRVASRLSIALWSGFLCGLVIGGIGGRLAMLLLRLTSSPSLHGLETDDGFRIGAISGDSVFLVGFMAVVGALGGLLYLAVRRWLPERGRPAIAAVIAGLGGGALIVHPDGIDFRVLEPLWLAIALFVALPALYGAALSFLVERFLQRSESAPTPSWPAAFLPLLLLGVGGPFGLIVLLSVGLGWYLLRDTPLKDLPQAPPVVLIARIALVALTCLFAFALVRDSIEIL